MEGGWREKKRKVKRKKTQWKEKDLLCKCEREEKGRGGIYEEVELVFDVE